MAENFCGVILHVTVRKMLTYAIIISFGKFPRDLPANRHRRRAPSPLPLGTDLSLADEVGWIQFFLHVFSTCFVNKWPYPVLHGTKPRRYDFPIT